MLNAVTFNCTHTGEQIIIGRGAGGQVTASAVIRDIININQTVSTGVSFNNKKPKNDESKDSKSKKNNHRTLDSFFKGGDR